MNAFLRRQRFSRGVLLLLPACLFAAVSAMARPERGAPVQVPHCQVLLIHDVDVPARETGLLRVLAVREGELVIQGRMIAQLDDRDALLQRQTVELERDAAHARADDDIEVRYAAKSFELANIELEQSLEINRKSPGAVPVSEIRRLQLARHRAELQIDRSQLDLKVAQTTAEIKQALVQAAEESILRRQITAPFGGVVVSVLREAGEWVNAGEPVVRIVRLDELSVDGFLDGSVFDAADIAEAAITVEVQLAHGRRAQFPGQIVFVNPLIQAGNKFRIRAQVQNRQESGHWLLRPGMTATMHIPQKPPT